MLYSHGCATLCGFVIKVSAVLRVVVYTTLSRALRVQGIYSASISNIGSAVAGTAYVVCAEPFILWLPRLQDIGMACIFTQYTVVLCLSLSVEIRCAQSALEAN